jgi:hypothetical protein
MNVRLVLLQRHQTHIHATLGAELVRLAAADRVDIEAGPGRGPQCGRDWRSPARRDAGRDQSPA